MARPPHRREMTPEEKDRRRRRIVYALKNGATCKSVATVHGVDPKTIKRIIADEGIEAPPRGLRWWGAG